MTPTQTNTCLALLKLNIELTTNSKDTLLTNLLTLAETAIRQEGITLDLSKTEHVMLVVLYASWLYDKRNAGGQAMPRILRWQLNQFLLSEKMSDAT